MAEIVGEYGGITGGGDLAVTHHASVPIDVWNSWDAHTQDLWMQDYFRDPAKAEYYTMQDWTDWEKLAYTYTTVVDVYTGLDSGQVGEDVNEAYEQAQETYEEYKDKTYEAFDWGKDIGIAVAVLGAFVLLRK